MITMKKRVLHILNSNQFSGAENVCVNIIKNTSNDYESVYCSPRGTIAKKLQIMDVRYIGVDKLTAKNIKRVIKDWRPDIIHAHDVRASVMASIATYEIPIISQLHGNFPEMHKLSIKSILYFLASTKFSKILYVSRSIYTDFLFKKILDKKGMLYENKINPTEIEARCVKFKPTIKYDLIYIGRFEEVKNPLRFIEIVKKLQEAKFQISACMVGDGSLFIQCKDYCKNNNLKIDLVGYQEEPLEYLLKSKCLVITSKNEGIPMVALEAYSCLKPVISTPTDGLLELVNSGNNGYICTTDEDFVKKITDILSNQKLYSSMVDYLKCNNSVDYDQYKATLLNLYDKVCGGKE